MDSPLPFRIRHASIDSRPHGASMSDSRHQPFPSSHITDNTFIHVESDADWPDSSSAEDVPFCGRAVALFGKWRSWIRQHAILSLIVGIVVLLLLLLAAAAIVVLFTLHPVKNPTDFKAVPGPTASPPHAAPTFYFHSDEEFALPLPSNMSRIDSFEPCRRTKGTFFALGNQTLMKIKWNPETKEAYNSGCEVLNIDRKNCSKCHLFDRRNARNALDNIIYCCSGCSPFTFFCSVYGSLQLFHEEFVSGRVFLVDQKTVVFHLITETEIGRDSYRRAFQTLHKTVIDGRTHRRTIDESSPQEMDGIPKNAVFSSLAYWNSSHLNWRMRLDSARLQIYSFDEKNSTFSIWNFLPLGPGQTERNSTKLFCEAAQEKGAKNFVVAASSDHFAVARFTDSSYEQFDAFYYEPTEVVNAAIVNGVLFIGSVNGTDALVRVVRF
ncbi:hypothetical protein L596_004435 [Steinernema carpocapsae]|uniref:Uncharacterized protein n=1 Tax=Steinernema carpocapsae TaxID=34508 RepID=A0A4U8UVT1_STECR|nr:hypothetical protein L596_004435 [Steinernema carpocapsae]